MGMTVAPVPGWQDDSIKDWDDFDRKASDLARIGWTAFPEYAFRGQSKSWADLMPSLARILRHTPLSTEPSVAERELILAFVEHAARFGLTHVRAQIDGASLFRASVAMQHFRAPTRLLDWTYSPYVAAYFAVRDDPHDDGVIWAAPLTTVNIAADSGAAVTGLTDQEAEQMFGLSDSRQPRCAFVRLMEQNDRSAAQQALMSIASTPDADHAQLIAHAIHAQEYRPLPPRRFIIASDTKSEFLRSLRVRCVHAGSMFPGLDGLGRSVNELALLSDYDRRKTDAEIRKSAPAPSRTPERLHP